MRVLVLGATGFIGGQIVRSLTEHGHTVRAFRRPTSSLLALQGLPVEFVQGDLLNRESLVSAMRDCEGVFHAAGYYPPDSLSPRRALRQAVTGMRSVLDAAHTASVRRLIYTSSLSTVGPPSAGRQFANEHDIYLPGSIADPYFEAKWAMECEAYRAITPGLEVVTICPTVVFGPGDIKPTTGVALLALARGLLPTFVEGKTNTIDVRDLAAAHVTALEHGRSGERYIVGGHNIMVSSVLQLAARVLGVAPPRLQVPAQIALATGKLAEVVMRLLPNPPFLPIHETIEMIRHGQHYDCQKAQRELGITTRPLEETFQDAREWFERHGYLKHSVRKRN